MPPPVRAALKLLKGDNVEIPTMRTWVDGETVTPQHLNEQVRDTGNFLLGGRPAVRVSQKVTAQTLANTSWVGINMDTVEYDTDGMWDVLDPAKITISTSGLYLITGQVCFTANATGPRLARIVSTTSLQTFGETRSLAVGYPHMSAVSTVAYLAEGNQVTIEGLHGAGGDLDTFFSGDYDHSNISAVWISS